MSFLRNSALLVAAAWSCHAVVVPEQPKRQAVLGTATVNLAVPQGTPAHRASGFLYGIPDTAGQVPSNFYTDMGFNYARAGGSQLPSPALGWVYGTTNFQVGRLIPDPLLRHLFNCLACLEPLQFSPQQLPDCSELWGSLPALGCGYLGCRWKRANCHAR